MLRKIAKCYGKGARLKRMEFFVAQILIALVTVVVFSVYSFLISIEIYQANYLIGKSILELILYVAVMPIYVARLKYMAWPFYLVFLMIPLWLFTPRNTIIYMHIKGIEQMDSTLIFYAEVIFGIIFLVLFLCMLFFRSASNKPNAADHPKLRFGFPR